MKSKIIPLEGVKKDDKSDNMVFEGNEPSAAMLQIVETFVVHKSVTTQNHFGFVVGSTHVFINQTVNFFISLGRFVRPRRSSARTTSSLPKEALMFSAQRITDAHSSIRERTQEPEGHQTSLCKLKFENLADLENAIDIFWEHPNLKPAMANTWDGEILTVPKSSLQILEDSGVDITSTLLK